MVNLETFSQNLHDASTTVNAMNKLGWRSRIPSIRIADSRDLGNSVAWRTNVIWICSPRFTQLAVNKIRCTPYKAVVFGGSSRLVF